MLTENQIKEIKEKGLFDFLGNRGWELEKSTIITMFKEFNFAVYEIQKSMEMHATNIMLEELANED